MSLIKKCGRIVLSCGAAWLMSCGGYGEDTRDGSAPDIGTSLTAGSAARTALFLCAAGEGNNLCGAIQAAVDKVDSLASHEGSDSESYELAPGRIYPEEYAVKDWTNRRSTTRALEDLERLDYPHRQVRSIWGIPEKTQEADNEEAIMDVAASPQIQSVELPPPPDPKQLAQFNEWLGLE